MEKSNGSFAFEYLPKYGDITVLYRVVLRLRDKNAIVTRYYSDSDEIDLLSERGHDVLSVQEFHRRSGNGAGCQDKSKA